MFKNRSTDEKVGIYIILVMILIVLTVFLLYVFGILGKEKPSANIIVDNSIMFKYSKKKWEEVDSENYSDYNWNKYIVYEQGKKKGKYSVFNNDSKFYVFLESSSSRTPINVVGDSIYIGGKINTQFFPFEREDVSSSDLKYIRKVLDSYNISRSDQNKYTYRYKIIYDFDGDNENEEMFIVSNLFSEDEDVNNSFSVIFVRDNNNTKTIYKNVYGKNHNLTGCYAYLFGIIKVDKTKNYQLITKCSHYSVMPSEYGLYQYDNNNYSLLLYSK
ncbi:MAG: hypothetical protein IKO49_08295 [Bacilli bacterium]|nr:hypothetical protein [Bacilli bacterium]